MSGFDVEWYRARFPKEELLDLLRRGETEELLRTVAKGRALANPTIDLVARDPNLTAHLETARKAVEKIVAQGDLAELTPDEETALQFFVQLAARPALFVQQGTYGVAPRNWPDLDARRDAVTPTLRAVGRLDRDGVEQGTGFLLSSKRLLTNNHVLWLLVRRPEDPEPLGTWSVDPALFADRVAEAKASWGSGGTRPTFDLGAELGAPPGAPVEVASIVARHDDLELAVLELAAPVTAKPLELAEDPGAIDGRSLYVVGYPALIPTDTPMHQFERAFPDSHLRRVKRLSPGRALAKDSPDVFRHDCSTLGGSSGSPVLDLETGLVLGIHYAGSYLAKANFAVPLWEHLQDGVLLGAIEER